MAGREWTHRAQTVDDSNLDRSLHIYIDCNHEKETSFGKNSVL